MAVDATDKCYGHWEQDWFRQLIVNMKFFVDENSLNKLNAYRFVLCNSVKSLSLLTYLFIRTNCVHKHIFFKSLDYYKNKTRLRYRRFIFLGQLPVTLVLKKRRDHQ